ncbi:MAG: hypothetical protein NVSMB56_14510 [Pyrinomonadaceae bacterium]
MSVDEDINQEMARAIEKTLIAQTLSGAWRATPPESKISAAELEHIMPLLIGSGAGALGWWRLRDSELRDVPRARELRDAYRQQRLINRVYEKQLMHAVADFRAAGIEPLLVKGRAVANFYPEPGLRPYGDFDFCVPPEQFHTAQKVTDDFATTSCITIDPHRGLDLIANGRKVNAPDTDAVFARTDEIRVGDCMVRVPSAEDHLRILCLHFLKHGGARPLWLCDVGAVLEANIDDFDWDVCLGDDRKQRWKIVCVIKLAQQLFDARAENELPLEYRKKSMPNWLTKTVSKQWETPFTVFQKNRELVESSLRHPTKYLRTIRHRWIENDAIRATELFNARYSNFPRLPSQLALVFLRVANFTSRMLRGKRITDYNHL